MALYFDGAGTVVLASPWKPSNPLNFEVEIEFEFPGDLGYNVFASLIGKNDNKGAVRVGNDNYAFNYEGAGSSVQFKYLSTGVAYQVVKKIALRVVASNSVEVYFDDAASPSETLTFDAGKELVDYTVTHLGSRGGVSEFLPAGAVLHSVALTDLEMPANSSLYLLDEGAGGTVNDSGALGNGGTLTGFADLNAAWGASGLSIPAAEDITDESQPATFTLSGNENAPTGITINGEAGSNITFVSENTGAGTETYSYEPPLIADDDTADLLVSVDGATAATVIAYANSYDRDQLTHPATEPEYSENSLSYPNAYATTQPYEWKVIADANASVVTIDWNALEADDGFHKDVASYATPVANGSTTVTLGVFVPETGQAYQFDRTITVSDGSVVVEGEGLFRSLFSALEKSLFKPLFR